MISCLLLRRRVFLTLVWYFPRRKSCSKVVRGNEIHHFDTPYFWCFLTLLINWLMKKFWLQKKSKGFRIFKQKNQFFAFEFCLQFDWNGLGFHTEINVSETAKVFFWIFHEQPFNQSFSFSNSYFVPWTFANLETLSTLRLSLFSGWLKKTPESTDLEKEYFTS